MEMRNMHIDEYQIWTRTTVAYPEDAEAEYLTSGLVGEVGELYSAMAKFHRGDYDTDEAISRMFAEFGDILWFLARFADYYGWSMSELIDSNIRKLSKRKDEGTLKGDGDDR
jgi:NTP pyrophosphatase (non-canonical NTP hydrolase)